MESNVKKQCQLRVIVCNQRDHCNLTAHQIISCLGSANVAITENGLDFEGKTVSLSKLYFHSCYHGINPIKLSG